MLNPFIHLLILPVIKKSYDQYNYTGIFNKNTLRTLRVITVNVSPFDSVIFQITLFSVETEDKVKDFLSLNM